MPLFVHTVGHGDRDGSSDEGTECAAIKRVHELEETLAAVNSDQYERLPYPIIVDPGVAGSVIPSKWVPQAALLPSSQKGKSYSAANGSAIKNEGSKVISAVAKEGQWTNLTFQVANATKALASVSNICAKNQSVIYHPEWHDHGSYIYNWDTDEHTALVLKDGVYVLDAMIAPTKHQVKPSFGRPGL